MTTEPGSGWRPGIVGWIVMQHGEYYAREWDFGAYFEAKVAREVGEFVDRLDKNYNHLLWEIDALGPLAAVSVDGDDAENGLAHLRWFIASDRGKGQGVGRRLIDRAIAAVKADGAEGLCLRTFSGLHAAHRLYSTSGFDLVDEARDRTWGTEVTEQRWELRF